MRIAVEHSDNHAGERNGHDGTRLIEAIEIGDGCARARIHVGRYCLDENHAQALILALQAAVAEVQARAVSL